MPPRKTKRPLKPTPVAARAAVGQDDAPGRSNRRPAAIAVSPPMRPIRSKVTFLSPLCTLSRETYQSI